MYVFFVKWTKHKVPDETENVQSLSVSVIDVVNPGISSEFGNFAVRKLGRMSISENRCLTLSLREGSPILLVSVRFHFGNIKCVGLH